MNRKNPMHANFRFSRRPDCPFHALRPKRNLRMLLALEYFSMHLPVAHAVVALAALRIHHDFPAKLSRSRIKIQRSPLQPKSPVHCMQRSAQGEIYCSLLRIQSQRNILRHGTAANHK